jgi:hypothetical protein
LTCKVRIIEEGLVGMKGIGRFFRNFSGGGSADPHASETDKMRLLDRPELAPVRQAVAPKPAPATQPDAQAISQELLDLLLDALRDQSGVQVETALALIGALAGFSAQMAIRESLVVTGKVPEDKAFVVVETKNGEKYYFGDALNEFLFEHKPGNFSVYAFVGGAAQKAGASQLPSLQEIAAHVARTIGTEKFGILRLPADNAPKMDPIALLQRFWDGTRNFLVLNRQPPMTWPFSLGLTAQKLILMAKDTIDPALASKIVMEAAIAMAKVDPTKIRTAYLKDVGEGSESRSSNVTH